MKRFSATLAAIVVAALGTLAVASPATATPDPHYATGEWQLRDWAGPYPEVETSPASESTADCDTVTLTKPDTAAEPVVYPPTGNGDIGTSYENTDLDLAVESGDALVVDYTLSDSANADAGAVRMFAYDTADADTLNDAPTFGPAIATGASPSTLTITFTGDSTIGTFGLTYDASNDTEGTVTFTNLQLVKADQSAVAIALCPKPAPPATTTGGSLANTGANLTMVVAAGIALVAVGGVALLIARRRRA